MVWLNDEGVVVPDEDVRCGTMRASMKKNVLISKPDVGEIKKSSFVDDKASRVYGMPSPHDGESAKEVTMRWQEHVPKQQRSTQPDFKTMNKLAAMSGITSPKQLATFRQSHSVTVKKGEPGATSPQLPSDVNPCFTYGMPSAHRSSEVVRNNGPEEPKVKHLVQGAYQHEWVYNNLERSSQASPTRISGRKDSPTRASLGHALGARTLLAGPAPEDIWKMSKFQKVPPRVTQYMGKQ